ncbi:MAG TPA: transporter associated domain-containing protein, partial [Steroidobacteraceae bacterium]
EEVDTLGGYLATRIGRLPVRGELVPGPGPFEIEVLDADPRRVKRVRIHRSKQASGGPDEARPARGAAAALPPSAITSTPAAEPATASTDPAKAARQP